MINSPDVYLMDLTRTEEKNGAEVPHHVQTLASYMGEGMNKQLTMEIHLRAEFPAVVFCVYNNMEGLFASNTLDEAVDAYNKAGTDNEDQI